MSRHSSDVFEELVYYSDMARRELLIGQFKAAQFTLSSLQALVNEARCRLQREIEHKKASEQAPWRCLWHNG